VALWGMCAMMLALPAVAEAGTIGPSCQSCQGGVYTLTYNSVPVATSPGQWNVWQIALTIDSRYFDPNRPVTESFIDEVGIKVSSSIATAAAAPAPRLAGFTVLTSPTSSLGVSNWTAPLAGGVNAGGCSGSGGGFLCADYLPSPGSTAPGVPVNGIYRWTFEVPVSVGALFTPPSSGAASIKARYVTAAGDKIGALVSEDISLTALTVTAEVPEPLSFTLLLTAVAGFTWKYRKRLKG
jgi:hypothetical protein